MNDPGLDKPISDEAQDVENQLGREKEKSEDEEERFLLGPSRWWFASTAFPLIAGTLGPMASAFSICALSNHWRVYIPPGATQVNAIPVPDPPWLLGVNAAQLAIALASNLSLLLNMARRVRFEIAQPITVIGWYLSSFILVGLLACAVGPLKLEPKSDHTFSQAYYYAIFAAVLYFFIASLMVVTVWGAYRGQYDKQFQLTMSQRTLMLQTISFLMYLLLGSLVYSHIEGWLFHDAVYWADFTLLTIGIGNYAPMTHLGRGLLFPYAIGGIIILGLVIGSVRSLVLDRGKAKMEASMVEKERRRLLDKLQKKNKADILQPITKENTPVSRGSTMPIQGDSADFASAERSRRKKEFRLMRKIQEKATSRERWAALLISGSTWLLLWIVGAAIFEACEKDQNWSYFVSLYFSYTSLLTIGYGDFYPESNSGKAFFVFWSLLAVPSLTILISNMGDTVIKEIRDLTIWIGNFTVLPGERGVRVLLKEAAHKVTGGRIFNDSVIEIPPGILGENNKRVRDEGIGEGGDESRNDRRSTSPRAAGLEAQQEANATEKYGKRYERLPQSRRHYHSLLIKEIGLVIKHLKSSPPRKYTFEEWAWYLKLIGEDESFADLHNRPSKKPVSDGAATGIAKADKGGQEKWSWVGDRSPLIGQKDESEWVLERLTKMLDRELEEMKDEMDGERDLPMDGSWRRESTHDRDDGPLPDNSHSPVEDKAKGGS